VSDDPALRELIDDAGAGIVVPPGAPADLADALDRLLGDAALAERLGEAGRRVALERHTTEVVVPNMRVIYERARALAR
jgi:glycosyltransferase involved in cell wall biosynthesis